ncbi:MAG TPA: symmetrical bis(5'-nucleosyl)-tetraphosphatase [Gammaproteobacteria bacterium]|nr:symmetrical bis(5'-nucleosyl)-tetraphosphatase [Gammaproteobacteria bacterium]
MAVYAIGDVQGCYTELRRLLDSLHFDPARDQLWFVGDLVNRGPQSLECLRFVKDLGDGAVVTLGNHDLSLLLVIAGVKPLTARNTTGDILRAPDRDELFNWLRHRPLLHHDPKLDYVMIHAGLPPQWDLATAKGCARELESLLRSENYLEYFQGMYGDMPDIWSENLQGVERWRFITNCFTRMRYCTAEGRLDLDTKGKPSKQDNKNLYPWFRVPGRRNAGMRILFGHWSALGLVRENGVTSLDTGCVWGGALTAMRLDTPDPRFLSVACTPKQPIED